MIPEDCDCPSKDIKRWFDDFGCKGIHKQISEDLSKYTTVNFEKFYKEAANRINNSLSSSVCHYVIKSNKVFQ